MECTSGAGRSPDTERPFVIETPPKPLGGWYDVGRGLLLCGMVGRAVGGRETADTEEVSEGGRFSCRLFSDNDSSTVCSVVVLVVVVVVALLARAGAGGRLSVTRSDSGVRDGCPLGISRITFFSDLFSSRGFLWGRS
jgi:hypothetical protein